MFGFGLHLQMSTCMCTDVLALYFSVYVFLLFSLFLIIIMTIIVKKCKKEVVSILIKSSVHVWLRYVDIFLDGVGGAVTFF